MTSADQQRAVDAPADQWSEFLKFLQYEVWIDYEVVMEALEKEIKENREADRVLSNRAFNLARLQLALIQAQVQAAPDWFVNSEASDVYILLEAAKETARFFEWIKPYNRSNPSDLVRIPPDDLPEMQKIAKEMEIASWKGDTLDIRHSRSVRKHRALFAPQANIFRSHELLKAHTSSAGSAPLSADVLERRRGAVAALERILR